MNKTTAYAVLAFAALGAESAWADNRTAVYSSYNEVVLNTFANCVRTKTMTGQDVCAPAQPQIAAPVSRPHAVLAQEERTVYFEFNRAALDALAKQRLDTLANVLKSEENVKEARIVGYADRMGSASYNEQLSKKRAEAVREYMVSRGFVNARVADTRWYGEQAPATSCSSTLARNDLIACLAKDRKVEVEIDYLPEGKATERR